jgi:hypothetical protein
LYRSPFQRAAIDQKRMSSAAQHSNQLIHDPTHRADVCLLSLLRSQSDLNLVNIQAGNTEER